MTRVLARVHVAGLCPGQWGDLDDGPQLDSLLEQRLVTTTGYRGEPAPEVLPPKPGCC